MERKLTLDEIAWTGHESQVRALRAEMAAANDDPNIKIRSMLRAVREWWQTYRPEGDETVFNYTAQAYSNILQRSKTAVPQWDTARILYAFFTFGDPKYARLSHFGLGGSMENDLDRFADQTLKFFRSGATIPYDAMLGLISDSYEAYRPSWRPSGDRYVIRSHIEIKRGGTALWMIERQEFDYDIVINELNEGLLFPFAHSICCFARADKSVKLYSFPKRDPDTSKDTPVDVIKGSVMAVSNTGPHWSGPIFIRRARGARAPMEHVEIAELEEIAKTDIQIEDMFRFFDEFNHNANGPTTWPNKKARKKHRKKMAAKAAATVEET